MYCFSTFWPFVSSGQAISAEAELKAVIRIMNRRKIRLIHCYDRECPDGWNYNLFVMIHAQTEEALKEIIRNISEKYGLKDYKVFKTIRELKKTSMKYF